MTPASSLSVITFTTHSADETVSLGCALGAMLCPGDVIAYRGTLGAGKTTMTKGIALALHIAETITSPTFCLVSEYSGTMPLYHIDAYRLASSDDFESIGADDMLYGHGVCVVEWSENVADALPSRTIWITLTPAGGSCRTVEITGWPYGKIEWPHLVAANSKAPQCADILHSTLALDAANGQCALNPIVPTMEV